MTAGPMRVVAVVVAHNRRELLVGTLDALAAQTRPVDAVLVVDNASEDGSPEAAAAHPAVTEVVRLSRNTGGAGGFSAGLAHALMTMAPGAIWLMDDDTAPTATALAELERAWLAYPGKLALASSRVVWTDGRDHPMNSARRRLWSSPRRRRQARRAGGVPVRTGSFVSMLIDAHTAWRHRLPLADYFIWNDDLEYSARLLRRGRGIAVAASVTVHHTKAFAAALSDPGDRFYYEVRNKIWAFVKSPAFGPLDAMIYSTYTVLGWFGAVARSRQKWRLIRAGLRGLVDGFGSRPRPNAEVLAGEGRLTAEVAAVDARAARP
ncbi:MAG: glycosyltransferase [Bifidobacteriaceae bacterium]|jgi:GT2 family glycosyltransferase|nr:glycosyltransferase [Bifidobacteriaceae bacterium]